MAAARSSNPDLERAALRRAGGVVVTLTFLASAMAWYQSASAHEPATTGAVTAGASSSTLSSPGATDLSPTPSSTTATPTPSAVVGDPGIRLSATITGAGRVEVVEAIRLMTPTPTLSVAPPDLSDVDLGFDRVHPSVVDLSAQAAGQAVTGAPTELHGPVNLSAPNASATWELHYRLTDVVVRSTPSRAGRALAALGPLTAVPDDLPVDVVVSGRPVITLFCPRLTLDRQVCSMGAGSTHRVDHALALREAVVVAQLDLARSS